MKLILQVFIKIKLNTLIRRYASPYFTLYSLNVFRLSWSHIQVGGIQSDMYITVQSHWGPLICMFRCIVTRSEPKNVVPNIA